MDEFGRPWEVITESSRKVEKAAEIWHWSFVFLYFGALVFHTVAALRHRKAVGALEDSQGPESESS